MPPRTVKTATIRKPNIQEAYDYNTFNSIKASPNSNTATSYQKNKGRTLANASQSSKRRIIVAPNKESDMDIAGRNTDSGWNANRKRSNMTAVEENT